MASPVVLYPPPNSRVAIGGTAVVALGGPLAGGIICNPGTPADQGIAVVEPLFVDIVQDATLGETVTSIPIQPGGYFFVPANQTTQVSVNAATSGHRFSAVAFQPPPPYPPSPSTSDYPPTAQTSLTKVIPSYLYQEYNDDEDLQAFVSAYNQMTQNYVDTFNALNLPIYTGDIIAGALLDWVAAGLYGITRPGLSSGKNKNLGPLNTYVLNALEPNQIKIEGPQNYTATSDDIFKRIITWHFYKGDGKVFNIRWLKRRILRFLIGVNGTAPNVDDTSQISVTFGVGSQVNIRLIARERVVTGGAIPNMFALNAVTPNSLKTKVVDLPPLPNAAIFQEAVDSGVLELPFQFTYVVTIQ